MFSLKVVDSDAFLDMGQGSQLLYFHLAMRADDDGFVGNHKKIMRMVGSSEDDMKVLLAKRFLLPFESGIVVIKHWKIHNYIQSDRYSQTLHTEEKASLMQGENGEYEPCIQNVSKLDTQVRLELEEGKERKEPPKKLTSYTHPEFSKFYEAYPKKEAREAAYKMWLRHNPPLEDCLRVVRARLSGGSWKLSERQFIPNPSTFINQRRWEDEVESPEKESPIIWPA